MAIATVPRTFTSGAHRLRHLPGVVVMVGAAAVTAGAFLPWVTFFRGLVERNGVAGDGKYMIGLAVMAALAYAASSWRPARAVRWLPLAAAALVAFIAARDLRNLYILQDDPSTTVYFIEAGPGLQVALAGAALIAAGAIASVPPLRLRVSDLPATAIVVVAVAAAGMAVAGSIGQYYLHFAGAGHAHGHTNALDASYLLLFGAGALALAAASGFVLKTGGARRSADREERPRHRS